MLPANEAESLTDKEEMPGIRMAIYTEPTSAKTVKIIIMTVQMDFNKPSLYPPFTATVKNAISNKSGAYLPNASHMRLP